MPLKQYSLLLFGVIGLLIMESCKHELPIQDQVNDPGTGGGANIGGSSANTCRPDSVYFTQQVLPILISNCSISGCHDAASHQDGVVLTNYNNIISTADVRPGRPWDSELYEVITDNDPSDRMPRPPQNPLTTTQVQIIYKWILQGAKNNSCTEACDTLNVKYSSSIKNIISNKCQGCHSGGNAQGGIDLSSYTGVKVKVTDGRLWGAINHQPGFSPMPKNGNKLSDCEISQFRIWINLGAPNN